MFDSPEQSWVTRAWRSPSIAVAVLDERFTITSANETFQQLAGGDREVGHPLISYICRDHRHVIRPLLARPAFGAPVRVGMFPDAGGVPLDVELTLVRSAQGGHHTAVIEPLLGPPAQAMTEVMRLNDELGETQRQLLMKNLAMEGALREVRESQLYIRKLEGILPMCMSCKSVRDDRDSWTALDAYLVASKAVQVSHALCPTCTDSTLEGLESGA